jgi:hypothetical protein
MKNLANYKVEEISYSSAKSINGGSILGKALGTALGILFRYSGPFGATQLSIDYATSEAIKASN